MFGMERVDFCVNYVTLRPSGFADVIRVREGVLAVFALYYVSVSTIGVIRLDRSYDGRVVISLVIEEINVFFRREGS